MTACSRKSNWFLQQSSINKKKLVQLSTNGSPIKCWFCRESCKNIKKTYIISIKCKKEYSFEIWRNFFYLKDFIPKISFEISMLQTFQRAFLCGWLLFSKWKQMYIILSKISFVLLSFVTVLEKPFWRIWIKLVLRMRQSLLYLCNNDK